MRHSLYRFIFLATFLFLLFALTTITTEVPVGAGSYNLAPPPGGAVPQDANEANTFPKVTTSFNKPIQTNG